MAMMTWWPTPGEAQERAEAPEEEMEPRHHPGLFLGATTSQDETGPSLGLEYEFRITEMWGIGGIFEFTWETEERDYIFLVPVHFHYKEWSFTAGAGIERARPVATAEGEEEGSNSALGRVGVEYGFEVRDFEIAPGVNFDVSEGEPKLVWGVLFSRGF
jgi:hypothetical protein